VISINDSVASTLRGLNSPLKQCPGMTNVVQYDRLNTQPKLSYLWIDVVEPIS